VGVGQLEHVVPAEALVVAAALAQDQWMAEPAEPVGLERTQLLQHRQAALGEHPLRHRRLQFRCDRLHALEAALQRLAQLVGEATVLAACAPGAGQTGALVQQRLPEQGAAGREGGLRPAVDQRPAAAAGREG
jgi:hypothetical protein